MSDLETSQPRNSAQRAASQQQRHAAAGDGNIVPQSADIGGAPQFQEQLEPTKKMGDLSIQNQGEAGLRAGSGLAGAVDRSNQWNPQASQSNLIDNNFAPNNKESPTNRGQYGVRGYNGNQLMQPNQQMAQNPRKYATPMVQRVSGQNMTGRPQQRTGVLSPPAGGMRPNNNMLEDSGLAPQYLQQNQFGAGGPQRMTANTVFAQNIPAIGEQQAMYNDLNDPIITPMCIRDKGGPSWLPKNPGDSVSNLQYDLVLPDRAVDKLMGPEPIPSIDIEEDEIQNELQKKLVDEIKCVMCGAFPYMPLECKDCHKIFCQSCQVQIQKGPPQFEAQGDGSPQHSNSNAANTSRSGNQANQRKESLGRQGNAQKQMMVKDQLALHRQTCPHCNAKGDFLTEVNPVVRNVVEFCEFPHKCYKGDPNCPCKWMTINELQQHVQMDECPKYGCDICYLPEFQNLTRRQLREHIKRECPEVSIQCQICSKEFRRGEFAGHKCLKDFYLQKLKAQHMKVIEYLSEKMMRNKRQKQQLGPCRKLDCLDQFRATGKNQQENMMVARQNINAVKCASCSAITQGQELVYFCMYCQDNYCNDCMAYSTYFDLQELESLLMDT